MRNVPWEYFFIVCYCYAILFNFLVHAIDYPSAMLRDPFVLVHRLPVGKGTRSYWCIDYPSARLRDPILVHRLPVGKVTRSYWCIEYPSARLRDSIGASIDYHAARLPWPGDGGSGMAREGALTIYVPYTTTTQIAHDPLDRFSKLGYSTAKGERQ